MQKVILLYGPPGSGKGTQANFIAKNFDYYHLDIGRELGKIFADPKNKNMPGFKEMKQRFDSGDLLDPMWFLYILTQTVRKLHQERRNLVFSGQGRTIEEIKGDEENKGLIDILEELFGKENIQIVLINVSEEISVERNSKRIICKDTGRVVMDKSECKGEVSRRTLDKPEIIRHRYKRYQRQTLPALQAVRDLGYEILEINGEEGPELVHQKIVEGLKLK